MSSFTYSQDETLAINSIELGLHSKFGSEDTAHLYIDNILMEYPDILDEKDQSYLIAIPICWVFAPNVAGVESCFEIGFKEGIEVDLYFSLGGSFKIISAEVGINLASWYISLDEDHYGVKLTDDNEDTIMHIRVEFSVKKKIIALPWEYEPFLDVLIDLNYQDSKYYDRTQNEFYNDYGWAPENPRKDGTDNIKVHNKEYKQNNCQQQEYLITKTKKDSMFAKIKVGLFLGLTVKAKYSKEYEARVYLWVDRETEPWFDYGVINDNGCIGAKPYVVLKPSTPKPVKPIDPKPLPPSPEVPTKPDPKPDPEPEPDPKPIKPTKPIIPLL
jgi:hypothetical protein